MRICTEAELETFYPGRAESRWRIIQHCRELFNDIAIIGDTDLGRVVGFGEDPSDYYYIIRTMDPAKQEYWASAVGAGPVSLRGKYDRYEHTDNIFSLNRAPKAETLLIMVSLTEPFAEFVDKAPDTQSDAG